MSAGLSELPLIKSMVTNSLTNVATGFISASNVGLMVTGRMFKTKLYSLSSVNQGRTSTDTSVKFSA